MRLYNKYISKEVPKYMKEHPETTRTEAFRAVAAMWKDDPSNPKNAPKPSLQQCYTVNPWATKKQEGPAQVAASAAPTATAAAEPQCFTVNPWAKAAATTG